MVYIPSFNFQRYREKNEGRKTPPEIYSLLWPWVGRWWNCQGVAGTAEETGWIDRRDCTSMRLRAFKVSIVCNWSFDDLRALLSDVIVSRIRTVGRPEYRRRPWRQRQRLRDGDSEVSSGQPGRSSRVFVDDQPGWVTRHRIGFHWIDSDEDGTSWNNFSRTWKDFVTRRQVDNEPRIEGTDRRAK